MLKKILAALTALVLSTGFVVATGLASAEAAPAVRTAAVAPQCIVDVIHHPAVAEVSHQESRYKKVIPSVTEVHHTEWRFQTRVYRPDQTVEQKFVKGYNFVDGGTVTVNGHTVSGHWIVSAGWHQIPDSVINAYWGTGGIDDNLLGGSESSPKGNVPLTVYGGPNVSVPYYAVKITIAGFYTDWGPWSDWTTTNPGASTSTLNVESRVVIDTPAVTGATYYYLTGGGTSSTLTDANWTTETPASPWALIDTRKVIDTAATDAYDENVYGACPTLVPGTPLAKDLCGTDNDHYGLPSGPAGVAYTRNGLDIIATITMANTYWGALPAGWVQNTFTTATYAFNSALFSNVSCDQPVAPVFPSQAGPTCDVAGGPLPALPTNQTGITFSWDADGVTMVATANAGYFFPGGTVATHLYTVPATGHQNTDASAPCYQTVSVTPVFPSQAGPTCDVAGAPLPALPTNQTGITFSWDADGVTMVATANAGYFFPGGTVATHLYTLPAPATGHQNTDASAPCYQLVSVTPSASNTDQICSAVTNHLENGSITVAIKTGVDYEITNDADVTQTLIPYSALTGQTAALAPGSYTVHPVAEAGYELTPSTDIPLVIAPYGDFCLQLITHPLVDPSSVQVQLGCNTSGSYTLSSDQADPSAVVWTVNSSTVAQNTYTVSAAGHYVIDAAPGPGYGFDATATTHWVYDFASPVTCGDLKTLALTGSTPDGLVILAGFLTLFGLVLTRRAAQARKTARD